MSLEKITKPTLLIDEQKCKRNIQFMVERSKDFGVELRPHFKTHQSLEIGRWFKEAGVKKITVSSLEMAKYFSKEWEDITVAFPINIREMDTINELASRINLNILVESTETVSFLINHLEHKVNFFIKLNIGNDRTGIYPKDIALIDAIFDLEMKSDVLNFLGFLGHAGQTYKCRSKEEIISAHISAKSKMIALKFHYQTQYPNLILSSGDTPSASVATDFSGLDELRPGNFVFYDLMQVEIGSCLYKDVAVALACPIVSIHSDRNELVIYGGGIHLSKDKINIGNRDTYGQVVKISKSGWSEIIPEMYVKSLSQEHGVVVVPPSNISDIKIGDLLLVLPVHSCMTANLMKVYTTLEGKSIEMMRN